MPDFTVFTCENGRGGGECIYIRDDFKMTPVNGNIERPDDVEQGVQQAGRGPQPCPLSHLVRPSPTHHAQISVDGKPGAGPIRRGPIFEKLKFKYFQNQSS